jgi:hypothetical protein
VAGQRWCRRARRSWWRARTFSYASSAPGSAAYSEYDDRCPEEAGRDLPDRRRGRRAADEQDATHLDAAGAEGVDTGESAQKPPPEIFSLNRRAPSD